ncbi:PfkB family carbohydrate kinase [Foetidibacter luteolus]|uniref:PfkB family carbohydrate kinase n=1 Tax=Foetidibacter luteolus TaxID=2608880 RepID=UPI00129B5CFF|nr:PfkB family carbohydrate kinase [Foetidibacter luteolus]
MNQLTLASHLTALGKELRQKEPLLTTKTVTAGFDGFVDTIVKIIASKTPDGQPAYFNTIEDFGKYILQKSGASFSLEQEQLHIKLGGNMPITATALGSLGINVNCIGALGYPAIHKAFNDMPNTCKLYSFAEPGTSTACEFTDGKMMIAQMGSLNNLNWSDIKNTIGEKLLVELYRDAQLWCMVNWSEIDASTGIWKGLLQDVIPAAYTEREKKAAFFDLSDCSKRSAESIQEALDLVQVFSAYAGVIISLNRNEAGIVYQTLYGRDAGPEIQDTAQEIFSRLKVDILVLHTSKKAVVVTGEGSFKAESFFTGQPVMSTGAGDNFNAGFCTAQLLQLDAHSSLLLANAVSGYYVRTGHSPQLMDVLNFLDMAIGKL